MEISLIIFILAVCLSFYWWKKHKNRNYFWLTLIFAIFIVNHILGFYVVENFLPKLKELSDNFFGWFDFALSLLVIWLLLNWNNKQGQQKLSENKKQWIKFIKEAKEGVVGVYAAAVIENEGKFLLLDPKYYDWLDFPNSDEPLDENSNVVEILRKGIKEKTGLAMIKIEKYLGVLGRDYGEGKMRIVCYLVKVKPGSINLEKRYKNYYYLSPQDKQFFELKISPAFKTILETAQKHLSTTKTS